MHHGARCSPGKHGKAAIWCKRKFAWSDQITLFHCAVVRFRPLLVVSAVKRGQYGHLDWPVVMQTHKQLTVMHCVFWQLSIKTSFFGDLSYSGSSVGWDHMGQPLLPTCICELWAPMILSVIHQEEAVSSKLETLKMTIVCCFPEFKLCNTHS